MIQNKPFSMRQHKILSEMQKKEVHKKEVHKIEMPKKKLEVNQTQAIQSNPQKITQNVIGITGNTGSGKSTVAAMLTKEGAFVLDADKLAHEAMEPGQKAYNEIVAEFGRGILVENKAIDRKKLGAIVFNDANKKIKLEQIVHPRVCEAIIPQLEGHSLAVIDAVLLVEAGLHKYCKVVWLITAPPEIRLGRIIARDELSTEAAEARMQSQRNPLTLTGYAQVIISNDSDILTLRKQVRQALEWSKRWNGEGDVNQTLSNEPNGETTTIRKT